MAGFRGNDDSSVNAVIPAEAGIQRFLNTKPGVYSLTWHQMSCHAVLG